MLDQTQSAIKLLEALTERAKELACLYAIEESLREPDTDIDQVCESIIRAIPPGWQYPELCVARIVLEGKEYQSPNFADTPWKLSADIVQHDHVVGSIGVYYTREVPAADIGPFLEEEQKLTQTIADRLNHFLTYKKMKHVFDETRVGSRELSETGRGDWEAVLDLIRQTDNALFLRISNKMLNHLCWSGVKAAEVLREEEGRREMAAVPAHIDDPKARFGKALDFSTEFAESIFRIAAANLSDSEILSRIQMWIQEDKLGALLKTVRQRLPLSDVAASLRRYLFATRDEFYDRYPLARGLRVLLIESILSNRIDYIERAKEYIAIEDLFHLLQRVIFTSESHGKLGGKSAGIFLAENILRKANNGRSLPSIRTPRTWYISSDMMLDFIHYNNMDEIMEQKYKDLERVRFEYPYVIEMFQQGAMPPDMINELSAALDDLGDTPVVVRASSVLEDRTGFSFAGKYKTVFLANQGDRDDRLRALVSAVAEVYASNFGPDPIEYRADRGLLEFSEQLGIMIQEVVGTRVGPYFLPAYSGVACSHNRLRWLPQTGGSGGLVLLVPGLGTGARHRSPGEYPVLLMTGQAPGAAQEMGAAARRAPAKLDVINLETNSLQTVELADVLKAAGKEYPAANQVVSIVDGAQPRPLSPQKDGKAVEKGRPAATFDGLINRSPFASHMRNLLRVLEEALGKPMEVEFASDGEHLFLLQCRPQCLVRMPRPAPIPKDLPKEQIVFSSHRYVSNGWSGKITHVVFIDPEKWAGLEGPDRRRDVLAVLTRLNELLPKKQFVLMRPGRSGRADGADASNGGGEYKNAAALIELWRREDDSGTAPLVDGRLLQDVVETGMLYLPLFSDDEGTHLNERFLRRSTNLLPELLPEFATLGDVIRVIDVPMVRGGKVMRVLMNAELGEAVAVLSDPEEEIGCLEEKEEFEDEHPEDYWRWRHRMAEQIASLLDPARFGVKGMYLFGSTKNGTAGPASDIDLLVHFNGTPAQRQALAQWLEGWSLCLDEVNYLRTGYRSGGLLDFHLITDEDIANKTSYAVKINAVTDAARPLPMNAGNGRDAVRPG